MAARAIGGHTWIDSIKYRHLTPSTTPVQIGTESTPQAAINRGEKGETGARLPMARGGGTLASSRG